MKLLMFSLLKFKIRNLIGLFYFIGNETMQIVYNKWIARSTYKKLFRKSARKVGGGLIKAIQSIITTFYSYAAYQSRMDDLLLYG